MKRFLFIAALFLTGCSAPAPSAPVDPASSSSSVSYEATDTGKLEALPSELSLTHFKSMRLSGTDLTLENIIETNDAYTKYAISYLSNGLKISGVLLLPHGDGPFPLVILNHGYIDTSVYVRGRGLKREQDYLARAGFTVLHTDYRGHADSDESPMTEKVYDGNLEYAMDSANAINAVRAANLPTVDARKVGMLGHSLGGGVTMAVLTGKPGLIDAAVLYAPVHANVWENFVRWRAEREEGDRTLEQFGTFEESPETWAGLSPLTYFKDITAPVLLFQGDKDKDVPKEWADFLAAKLEENGKDVSYIEYAGEGHEFSFQWSDFMKKTADFYREHLFSEDFVTPLSPDRITTKPFGLKVDPKNSPVSPEKFTGYHTGIDFEAKEGETDVPVRAACTGKVVYKQTVGGYGGVLIQTCTYKGEPLTVLYGHVRLSSIKVRVGDTLGIGQPFALLGKGYSTETDGERQHLHLGVHKGEAIELRGYVQSEEALEEWIKPF